MMKVNFMGRAEDAGRPLPQDLGQVAAIFDVELNNGTIYGMWLYRRAGQWRVACGEHDVKFTSDVERLITELAVAAYSKLQ